MTDSAPGFIDTHCNIPNILEQLKLGSFSELREIIKPVYGEQFLGCLSVSSDSQSRPRTKELMESEQMIWGCTGIHPLYAEEYTPEAEASILEFMKSPRAVAFGEIGTE